MEQIKATQPLKTFKILMTIFLMIIVFAAINYYFLMNPYSNDLPLFPNERNKFILGSILAILTPIIIIASKVIFLQIIEFIFQSIRTISLQNKILIATISYFPIILGSGINYLCTQWLGKSDYGYTTLYSYLGGIDNSFLIMVTSLINPFELGSVLLLTYLYIKKSKNNINILPSLILMYYVITILLSILFGNNS